MTFVSFNFYIFLSVIVFAYYLVPQKLRWTTLLLGSLFSIFISLHIRRLSYPFLFCLHFCVGFLQIYREKIIKGKIFGFFLLSPPTLCLSFL